MKAYHELINKALKADKRAKTLRARLNKFSLLTRLLNWSRFDKLRRTIKKYESVRAALTAGAMIAVRVTKKRNRR